ncbi:MAG: amino acid adenylation domain-containing protein [Ferruginibacter sp.]
MKHKQINKTLVGKTGKELLGLMAAKEKLSDRHRLAMPSDPTEITVYSIWEKILGHNGFGVNDDFFQVGGNSLKAIQLVSNISKQFLIDVQLTDIFSNPAIAELAIFISTQQNGQSIYSRIQTGGRPDYIPLSFNQERLWFLDRLEGSIPYHVPGVLRLKGRINKDSLEYALQYIVNRHEVLRTVFKEREGKLYQFVTDNENWRLSAIDGSEFKEDAEGLLKFIQGLLREPFNLSKDSMIRASLISLNEDEHLLVVIMHHIASDGWSLSLLIREVMEIYNYHESGLPVQLQPLRLQYADYTLWQKLYLLKQTDYNLLYWQKKLDNVIPLQLPIDFERVINRSTDGASSFFFIDNDLHELLRNICYKQGTTLFMLLLAGFKVLLHRYSGQRDICVGTSIANRTHPDVEGLIGFFVNTIALRDEVNPDSPFTDLLQQVKTTTLEAYKHQELPFEKVVEAVTYERDMSRTPLFQTMLVMPDIPDITQLRLRAIEVTAEDFSHNTSKFDITYFINETPGGLRGTVEYSTDLYQASTIGRMTEHFKNLLTSIAGNPTEKTGLLGMLDTTEEQHLVEGFSRSRVEYPQNKSVTELFEEQAARTPDATAVVLAEEQLSYQQLNERSNQLARYLTSRGIGAGMVVPLYMERSAGMITALLGIMKSGAAYVPIDPDFPAARINYMLGDTGAKLMVADARSTDILLHNDMEIVSLEEIADQPTNCLREKPRPTDAAYVIYTSGSTGRPKGVMISHCSLVDYYYGLAKETGLGGCNSFALVSTIATDLGNTVIYGALLSGGILHVFSKEAVSNIEYLHAYFVRHQVDCLKIVPSHWQALIMEDRLLLPQKLLIFGGEALQSGVAENIRLSSAACKIVNHYGPTETTIGKLLHVISPERNYNKTIPIGRPFSNTAVYVLSNELQLCPVGVPGHLYIAGDGLAMGYFDNAKLTAEKFITNPFSTEEGSKMYGTGDLVKFLSDGNIEFIGRVDDQVKIRGYRIEPNEVQSVLQECEEVSQSVVVATEDKQGNKRLVAYIVPEGSFDRECLHSYLKLNLPDYMVPSVLIELESLPLTPNGKIDRKALPDPDAAALPSSGYAAPSNETEIKLVAIWQEVLETDEVGIHDDFFELGGHSLLAVRLVSAIRKVFNIEMPIGDIFDYPTVALLSARIPGSSATTLLPVIKKVIPRPKQIPLSFGQERLWFIDQLGGTLQYHVPTVLRLNGKLDIEALSNAFQQIINRHEVLRTIILEEEGLGYQIIKDRDRWQLQRVDGTIYKQDKAGLQRYIKQCIDIPFDLGTHHMLRAMLIMLTEDVHILVVVLHHIASDGWSTSIIVKELLELYNARIENRNSLLASLPIQYADYAMWQRAYLQGALLETKLSYWKNKLQGVAPLQMPTDYPRPSVQSSNGATTGVDLDKELSGRLQALSQQEGVTIFMTLLGVLKVLLYRYSGQQDICVGTPIAGRQQQEVEGLIGFFINTLALRNELNENNSFRDLLQQVRVNTMEAYAHQELPFEKVLDAVVKERDMSRSPLFQVMLVLNNTPEIPELRLGEVVLSREVEGVSVYHTSKFDLIFNITETAQGLYLAVEYCNDLYNEQTIKRMMAHFTRLLNAVVTSPEQNIGMLPMLTNAEEQQLFQFNDAVVDYPQDKTIVSLFEEQAEEKPTNIALVFEAKKLTYKELNEQSNQLAHYLRRKGVKEDVLVPICIDRGIEMLVGILGILKAGGAYVPLDPEYPVSRISYMLEDTAAKIVVASRESRLKLIGIENIDVIEIDGDWSAISKCPADNLQINTQPHHLAYVIYTSGSTGRPKGVMIEHRNVVRLFKTGTPLFDFSEKDVWTMFHSFSFDFSVWEVYGALLYGGRLVIVPKDVTKDMTLFARLLADEQVSILNQTPAAFYVLQEYMLESAPSLQLRYVVFGGEALNPAKLKPWKSLFPSCRLINMYGITETTVHVTYQEIGWEEINGGKSVIGRPIPTLTMYVLDQHGHLLPIGVGGELCIGGEGLARGYLNQQTLTAERFIKDPFSKVPGARLYKSGDSGRWLPDGNIEYLGRIDEQVKIRGYRIELGEIETVLQQSGLVSQAVVVAQMDELGVKRLVGYIVSQEEFNKEIIQAYLLARLPDYMVPALWVTLEQLPLTSNGKLDKRALPPLDPREILKNEFILPRTQIEQQLAEIWSELLGVKTVGVQDNFFELGGDSILTIQVVSRARRIGYELQPRDVFIHQTIAKLSIAIEDRAVTINSGEQGYLTGRGGLLPIQQWYLEKEPVDKDHFNQAVMLGIDKSITPSELSQAVSLLMGFHDALRFRYFRQDGQWQQEYGTFKGQLDIEDLQLITKDTIISSIIHFAEAYQRSLDITNGELVRVVWMKTPSFEVNNRLLIVIHHLAIDGVSWRILLEDLELLLNGIKEGEINKLGHKTISYRQWYQALEKYGSRKSVLSQLGYWQQALNSYHPLPADKDFSGLVPLKEMGICIVELDAQQTSLLLQEVPRVYHTEINDILLAALALTITGWSKNGKVMIGLEGHGREEIETGIDTSRTIGWFTSLYPLSLSVDKNRGAGDLIKSIKEQLRALPDKGIGYGVLKYINKENALSGGDPWEIVFNYFGQLDNVVRESKWLSEAFESTGTSRSREQVATEKMAINAMVQGGKLLINWRYSTRHYYENTINILADTFVANLQHLIAHCMVQLRSGLVYTPSDYGLGSEITYAELDKFLEEDDDSENIISF